MNGNGIYRSPLFYVGDKYKLISYLKKFFPAKINNFIEPFVGGGTVFLNVKAKNYFLNDIDENLITLHRLLIDSAKNENEFFDDIFKRIEELNLSCSFKYDIVPLDLKKRWKKTYYAKFNKDAFDKLKKNYNKNKNPMDLYLLLIYGFNRMLRFNAKGEYNLPVGNVDFNQNVFDALKNYFSVISGRNIKLFNLDFIDFLEKIKFEQDDFVYLDPPYLISYSEYNKLWNEDKERKLIKVLEKLNDEKINFAISNVISYRGKTNGIFLEWAKNYNFVDVKSNYISYHNNSQKDIREVLVFNYDISIAEEPILDFSQKIAM